MLQLQRASAGSGKTYLLAKKFIEYFISVKNEDATVRLRRPQELRDALCHILAITFTNKATNEMKLRIVSKLDEIARWTPDIPVGKVDYLGDFSARFGVGPQEIADICSKALKVLLSDYGDFKVSTIDSFFQTVLRTFAYEADLDDTYQIELDSNYVTQMGLDTTLDAIETESGDMQGKSWIDDMMDQRSSNGAGWNIFQKQDADYSVYRQVLNASKNLEKEDFKEIREQLDDYFERHPDFYATFNRLRMHYEHDLRAAHEDMRVAAIEVRKAFEKVGLDIHVYAGQHLASRVENWSKKWKWDYFNKEKLSIKAPSSFPRKGTATRVFDPRKENPYLGSAVEDEIEALALKMYKCFDVWRSEALSEKMMRWRIYTRTLPYVGLLQSVRNNTRLFLNDNNTVELGETNSILNRIIGDDDAPFIYERIGSRLDHFLIDEFQDTSRMQWNNLHPLLVESEGKGFDNLIIGDAKQSIYRFRNADPGLITHKVPSQFPDTCRECGNTPEENTNWRSSRRIVEFNNLFFRYFTRMLSPEMENLYSNTVQPPHNTSDSGFVSIQLFTDKGSKEDENTPPHFQEIPDLIDDMLSRGYRMGDIAVLVDKKKHGVQIIECIMAHNRREDVERKIDFISADSLKIGESPAVQAIVAILEAVNNGTKAQLRPKEQWSANGIGDWSKLKADFSFFAQQHPDLPLSELLSRFLKGEYNPDAIIEMLAAMTTTVLPALVENIVRHFISPHVRRSEAPFIAAFQDLVLEFCEGYNADISSFLSWWYTKGRYRSITSPEDADAVQIMTVHKSKGLEFRCVIVPYSTQTLRPAGHEKEWLWVTPDLREAADIPVIPCIPVWSDPALAETCHADVYEDYLRKYLADKVNMAYVAYTRAIDELYIFAPVEKGKDDSVKMDKGMIGEYLWQLGLDADSIISNIREAYPGDVGFIPAEREFDVDADALCWRYGAVPSASEVKAATEERMKNKKKDSVVESVPVTDYRCGAELPGFLYRDVSAAVGDILTQDEEEDSEEESEEIRRYGDLMHSIMQYVDTPGDVDRALMIVKSKGLINHDQVAEYKDIITSAMAEVKEYGWFEPGLNVVNERALASHGDVLRPDRMILHPDGTATIVDYKFGSTRKDKKYLKQVRRYARTLTGSSAVLHCDAYIWYVSLSEVLKA